MLRSTRIIWVIMLILGLLMLAGCGTDTGGSGADSDYSEEELESARDFIISDEFPYPGKKADCIVLDKPTNYTYSIYIYVITKGEAWKNNDVRDIRVSYYDNTRPGVVIEYDQIFVQSYQGKTYIRVDNISYPENARGYFLVEGEIKQGNHFYPRPSQSNVFSYGDPGSGPIPIDRDYLLYEKEYVE